MLWYWKTKNQPSQILQQHTISQVNMNHFSLYFDMTYYDEIKESINMTTSISGILNNFQKHFIFKSILTHKIGLRNIFKKKKKWSKFSNHRIYIYMSYKFRSRLLLSRKFFFLFELFSRGYRQRMKCVKEIAAFSWHEASF